MRHYKLAATLLATAILAGCGSGDGNDSKYQSLVSFGDSLSDVGTYAVGTVKGVGGGRYTVNSPEAKTWVEVLAARMDLPAPCAAQTGLNGDPVQGLSVPVTNFPHCTAYAQGGARVTNPVGPGNKALGGANASLGQLTVPVVTQIQTHLATNGGNFSGEEMVLVFAGGNDVFIQLATVGAGGDPTQSVTAMGVAGAELAGYIKSLIVGKGAKYVTVVNLPDMSLTPFGVSQGPQAQGLISAMVTTFNSQLSAGLSGVDVLLVDGYMASRSQIINPASFGIANAALPACDLSPAKNLVGNSLTCNLLNVIAGTSVDNFLFADGVHLTPYGYKLLADEVETHMKAKGWL